MGQGSTAQVEFEVRVTLKRGKAEGISFQKTGFGKSEEEAKANANQKLEEDPDYQRLIRTGWKAV